MKNKLEQKLDRGFMQLEVKPCIFHFIAKYRPFTAVTIADNHKTIAEVTRCLDSALYNLDTDAQDMLFPASKYTINVLQAYQIYGIALCSLQDQFNRQRGRIIAKGRLLKHLKEMNK